MATGKEVAGRLRREYHYLKGLMKHPRTPRTARWCIGVALAYLMSPIDLIPDFIPVLGQLDDLLVMGTFVGFALLLIPGDVKRSTRQRTRRIYLLPSARSHSTFETEPLPGEFGVRIYKNRIAEEDREQARGAFLQTLVVEKIVVADLTLQQSVISPHHNLLAKETAGQPSSLPETRLQLLPADHGNSVLEFVDLAAAYTALPAMDQKRLLRLNVCSTLHGNLAVELPMVCVHPLTGAHFLNVGFTAGDISGPANEDLQELLADLQTHVTQRQFRYIHRLKPNEIIAWDSTAMLRVHPTDATSEEPVAAPVAYRLTLMPSA